MLLVLVVRRVPGAAGLPRVLLALLVLLLVLLVLVLLPVRLWCARARGRPLRPRLRKRTCNLRPSPGRTVQLGVKHSVVRCSRLTVGCTVRVKQGLPGSSALGQWRRTAVRRLLMHAARLLCRLISHFCSWHGLGILLRQRICIKTLALARRSQRLK